MKILSGRQLRSVKVTSVRWQRRAMFLMGGVAVGAAAVALAYLADWAQEALAFLLAKSRYASLVVTPLGSRCRCSSPIASFRTHKAAASRRRSPRGT